MQTIRFQNGDEMPALGLGTWKSSPEDAEAAVGEALRAGYRHVDCAKIYLNEDGIGRALRSATNGGTVRRDELWITSKLWNDGHREADVRPALEATLRDLQLDHLDLYLMHWPVAHRPGVLRPEAPEDFLSLDEVPLVETWRGLEAAQRAGLCRHIGVSNFSVPKLRALREQADQAPEMNQIELHPYLQQRGQLEDARANGMALTAYSPLGSFDRPDTMKAEDEPVLLEDAAIGAIAARLDASPAQVLIRWALQRGTAVIPKTTRPERMRENLAAAALELTADDMAAIGALDRARRYIDGTFWERPGGPYTVAALWDE